MSQKSLNPSNINIVRITFSNVTYHQNQEFVFSALVQQPLQDQYHHGRTNQDMRICM